MSNNVGNKVCHPHGQNFFPINMPRDALFRKFPRGSQSPTMKKGRGVVPLVYYPYKQLCDIKEVSTH